MNKCPTCGHTIHKGPAPSKALVDAQLSPQEQRIVAALVSAYPRRLSIGSLMDAVYFDDPQGGPECARESVSMTLSRLRAKLPIYGWTIPPNIGSAGQYGLSPINKGSVSEVYAWAADCCGEAGPRRCPPESSRHDGLLHRASHRTGHADHASGSLDWSIKVPAQAGQIPAGC